MYNLQNVTDRRFNFLDCVGIYVDRKQLQLQQKWVLFGAVGLDPQRGRPQKKLLQGPAEI